MSDRKLSPKQELFIKEYLIDLNATQAALRAKYKEKTAYSQGQRLLKHVEIARRIKNHLEKKMAKIDISADRILNELARVAFGKMTDVATWTESGVSFVPSADLSEDSAATISEVQETTNEHGGSLKIKQHDKLKALELLGKYQKLFTDRVEHTGKVTLEGLVAGDIEEPKDS